MGISLSVDIKEKLALTWGALSLNRKQRGGTCMEPLRLLVFVATEGVYHDHVGNGKFMAAMLSKTEDIKADFSQDYEVLTDGLHTYGAVMFYTDVGTLTKSQEKSLLSFITQGGGFFGLHTAAASFRECKGYHGMLNGFFNGHSKYMDFTVSIIDSENPITQGLEDFVVTDELYYLKHDPSKSQHLMEAYDPTKDETHVMSFKHSYGNGRVFFFALGHDMVALENPAFQKTMRRGALWASGRL